MAAERHIFHLESDIIIGQISFGGCEDVVVVICVLGRVFEDNEECV